MKAVVLAAGYGTRLRPMTDHVPKPAIPFCGMPMIAHTLRRLKRFGITDVVINVHHLGEYMEATARLHCPSGIDLTFSREPVSALGTAGGIAFARALLGDTDPLLVMNGDVLPGIELQAAYDAHMAHRPAATLLLTSKPYAREFFGVALDIQNQVVGFWGDKHPTEVQRCAYTGIQWLSRRLRQTFPPQGTACIKLDGWIPALERAESVLGVQCEGTWYDLGTPARYLSAHRIVADQLSEWTQWPERQPSVFSADPIPPHVRCEGPLTIGPGLQSDGVAHLGPHTHIGSNVTLKHDARVQNTVVWDNTTVFGDAMDSIIGPFGTISAAAS